MSGTIFTFYSYKGGVGRSMALANIGAYYYYRQHRKTLLIDWDLEAPGLERYFVDRFNLDLDALLEKPGLCDMIRQYIENLTQRQPEADDSNFEAVYYPAIEDYCHVLEEDGQSQFILMHAGSRSRGRTWSEYVQFVQTFDWTTFYEKWGGGIYLEWLRNQLKTHFELCLIDSRTGVTEMGGVATQHLADVVVTLCGTNLQNVENTARMVSNFSSDAMQIARDGRPLKVMVVPSRVDDNDREGYSSFEKSFREAFDNLIPPELSDGFTPLQSLLPYLAPFSYEETLIIGDEEYERTARRLVESYRQIAVNMQLLSPAESILRSSPEHLSIDNEIAVFVIASAMDKDRVETVSEYLNNNQIQVYTTSQIRANLIEEDILTEQLTRADCVIVLVTDNLSSSRAAQRLIASSLDINKPVIPVLLDEVRLPLPLATLQSIDLIDKLNTPAISKLIQTVHSYAQPTPEPSNEDNMIFISYAHSDSNIANAIYNVLGSQGYNLWMDVVSLTGGTEWQSAIESAIQNCRVFVPLISPESAKSRFLRSEWNYAFAMEKPIIPIRITNAELPLIFSDIQYIQVHESLDVTLSDLRRHIDYVLHPEQSTQLSSITRASSTDLLAPELIAAEDAVSHVWGTRLQPLDFRLEEVRSIMVRWQQGESCSLVGIGSVGKSNLLQHISQPEVHKYYLPQIADRLIPIQIDPNALTIVDSEANNALRSWSGYELLMHRLYLALYPFKDVNDEDAQRFRSIYEALQDATNPAYAMMGFRYFELGIQLLMRYDYRIVFMFDDFESFLQRMPAEFFQQLRSIRDTHRYRIMYLTFTRASLPQLVEKFGYNRLALEPFLELFSDNVYYVGPYNNTDSRRMIDSLTKRVGEPIPDAIAEFLIWSSGNYAGLLRSAFRAADNFGITKGRSVENADRLIQQLLTHSTVRAECQSIWGALTDAERTTLQAAVGISPFDRSNETENAIKELVHKRLVRINHEKQQISVHPPLFAAFIQQIGIS